MADAYCIIHQCHIVWSSSTVSNQHQSVHINSDIPVPSNSDEFYLYIGAVSTCIGFNDTTLLIDSICIPHPFASSNVLFISLVPIHVHHSNIYYNVNSRFNSHFNLKSMFYCIFLSLGSRTCQMLYFSFSVTNF